MFAYAAFNQQDDQQSCDSSYRGDNNFPEPIPAALLKVGSLQAGRDLKWIRCVHGVTPDI